ncbi:MAG: PP2C family serine/threonine-protein phosphatase [Gammaproteobacteria bacterium]
MKYELGFASRLGDRASNQDRCIARERKSAVLLVLADGMGGHAGGDLAAQILVDEYSRRFEAEHLPLADPARFLRATLERAHGAILEAGQAQHPPIQPRTTAVACLIQNGRTYWLHVGDSRLYLLRSGRMVTRTKDHTFVEDMHQQGMLTAEEIAHHPMRNYVTRCVGGSLESPLPTVGTPVDLQPDDLLLLCSDGFWSALPQNRIEQLIQDANLEEGLDTLAEAAQRASYPHSDNITAVALRWRSDKNASKDPTGRAAGHPQRQPPDPLTSAIAEIHRAIRKYGTEMQD